MRLFPELQMQVNAREQQMLDSIAAQIQKQLEVSRDPQTDPFDFTEEEKIEFRSAAPLPSDPLSLVPIELKRKPNWVLWRLEAVNGRMTKVPYQPNGSKASATDPSTWNPYERIAKGAATSDAGGVGIVTDGSFIGFDLDGCRNPETGEIKEWSQRIINTLGAYTEVTPSGYGIRVYAFGHLPENGPRRFSVAVSAGFGDKVGIEVYDKQRYFTVTGNRLGDTSKMDSPNVTQAYDLCRAISQEFQSEKRQRVASDKTDDGGRRDRTRSRKAGVDEQAYSAHGRDCCEQYALRGSG